MDFKCWTNSKTPVVQNIEATTNDIKNMNVEDVLLQFFDSDTSQTLAPKDQLQSQKLNESDDFNLDISTCNRNINQSKRSRVSNDCAATKKLFSQDYSNQIDIKTLPAQYDYDAFKSFIDKDTENIPTTLQISANLFNSQMFLEELISPKQSLPLKEISNAELVYKKEKISSKNALMKPQVKVMESFNAKTACMEDLFSQDSFISLADTQTLINNNNRNKTKTRPAENDYDIFESLIKENTNCEKLPKKISTLEPNTCTFNTPFKEELIIQKPIKETLTTEECSILAEFNSTQFDSSQLLKQIESEICIGKGERNITELVSEVEFKCNKASDKINSNRKPVQINNDNIVSNKSTTPITINQADYFYNSLQSQKKQFIKKKIENRLSSRSREIECLNAQFQSIKNEQVAPKLQDKTFRNINLEDSVTEEMSNLFKSSQYRKEVDLLFEKVETSICNLGPSLDDVPGNMDKSGISTIKPGTTTNDISWKDDSILENAILNICTGDEMEFGDFLKKALMENGHNVATPRNIANATLLTCEAVFRNLGNFYRLPDKVKDLMRIYRGIDKLYDWQDECLNLPAIKTHKNLVYAMPTSGGKTLVAEILILQEILCRKKNALFVLPFVAIVQEKIWSLSPFAVNLDFLIEEYAAGKGGYPPRKRRRKNCVYIATIEKALGLVNSLIDSGRLDELGLVVIDELHLIGDKSRGPTLEALLTKLICVQENIQIIGMSATIGNLSEICQFLNADSYTQNFRPVELTEFVKCGNELAKINWNAKDEDDLLMFARKAEFSYPESLMKLDPDCLGGLVMEVVPENSCLIFCSSKRNCENVALVLCRVINLKLREHKAKEKELLKRALEEESGNLCDTLNTAIPFGVAYHHSGLTSEERRLIEESFRTGVISVICCTSTLAAGVNLPAKRVILRQPYIGKQFINLSRYKQMVGRAGRAGLGECGESILIATTQDLQKVRDLLMSPMDQAVSFMHEYEEKGLSHLLLSCISLGIANTRPQLQNIVYKTLLGVQHERFNVDIKKLTDKAVTALFKFGALQINDDLSSQGTGSSSMNMTVKINSTCTVSHSQNSEISSKNSAPKSKLRVVINNDSVLVISKLGAAAIKGGLELTRAHILYEDLLHAQESLVLLDCLHLLYLITPYDVSEQIKPSKSHYYYLYSRLRPNELQTAKVLGLTESCAVRLLDNRPIKEDIARVLDRFYVTLMLYDLWNEVPVYQVSKKFQVARGIVQNLMTSSATFASNVVNFCTPLEEFWPFVHLLKGMCDRLQHCCVRELVPLMDLPSVKQNRAKQLYNAGYKSLASIARADPNELVEKIEYMSRKVANQLIAASKLLLLEKVENLREEAEDVLDGIEAPKILNATHL